MKNLMIVLSLLAMAFVAASYFPLKFSDSEQLASENEAKPLYWVAPMDPNYRRDKPGLSPMGMELMPVFKDIASGEEAGTVNISPSVENNLGVKTTEVQSSLLRNEINTVGYVRFDEDRLHHVHVRVEGWIENLEVSAVGEEVQRGQLLFELYSPALFNGQLDLVSALKTGNQSLIKSARQRLRLLGMGKKQIQQVVNSGEASERVSVRAQHSGIVSGLFVRHGMYIEPASEVMAIGSIDTVWVIAEVFERQAAWLQQGQAVSMTTDSYAGESWQASVDYIYPILDQVSRTVQLRVRIDNADQRLKPNMFADLVIHGKGRKAVMNIPRSAVIRSGHGQRVVKALGDGRYRSVPVIIGREAGNRIEIIAGLAVGDSVVTSAQFLIDSESNIDAETQRIDPYDKAGMDESAVMETHGDMDGVKEQSND